MTTRETEEAAAARRRALEAEAALEREYARTRQAETRFRLLFQSMSEPALIVDAEGFEIAAANPAARALGELGRGARLGELFAPEDADRVAEALTGLRWSGRFDGAAARLAGEAGERRIAAELFREDARVMFLVRIEARAAAATSGLGNLARAFEACPDAAAMTAVDGTVMRVNAAFLSLIGAATPAQAVGASIGRWLGRPGVDFDLLASELRAQGVVHRFETVVRDGFDGETAAELSAAAAFDGAPPCFAFWIRALRREGRGAEGPTSAEALARRVGHAPLREILRETTEAIERRAVEAALELTGDNRGAAAELLGVSRQSFYVKLRRYGLGGLEGEE